MAHVITEACAGRKDGACAAICPVECIHPKRNEASFEAATQLYVNPEECIDCSMCVDECPVSAIYPQDEVPAESFASIKANADHFATA